MFEFLNKTIVITLEDKPKSPPLPQFCESCGKKLILVEDPAGFYVDSGEPRFNRWFRCPDWKGGRTMYIPRAFITYTALILDRNQEQLVPMWGYTRYQTCDLRIVY